MHPGREMILLLLFKTYGVSMESVRCIAHKMRRVLCGLVWYTHRAQIIHIMQATSIMHLTGRDEAERLGVC
jgi:hypothetical protein